MPKTKIAYSINKVKVNAHGGACREAPEKTLSSISKALELSGDMIEVDVNQTKDNESQSMMKL